MSSSTPGRLRFAAYGSLEEGVSNYVNRVGEAAEITQLYLDMVEGDGEHTATNAELAEVYGEALGNYATAGGYVDGLRIRLGQESQHVPAALEADKVAPSEAAAPTAEE